MWTAASLLVGCSSKNVRLFSAVAVHPSGTSGIVNTPGHSSIGIAAGIVPKPSSANFRKPGGQKAIRRQGTVQEPEGRIDASKRRTVSENPASTLLSRVARPDQLTQPSPSRW
jgi:hypothetical protein